LPPCDNIKWLPRLKPTEVKLAEIPEALLEHHKKNFIEPLNEVIEKKEGKRDKTLQNVTKRDKEKIRRIANILVSNGIEAYEAIDYIKVIRDMYFPGIYDDYISEVFVETHSRDRALAVEFREWLNVTEGEFLVTDSHRELHIVTKLEKQNLRQVIKRACDEGLIEHTGNRGRYRKVEKNLVRLNWYDADEKNLYKVKLPLGVEELSVIFPRNIIVVGGYKNTGKTAFLRNTAVMNMYDFDIRYLISDEAEIEIKDRMVNISKEHNVPLEDIRDKIDVIERCRDFADAIKPDALNIIDHLLLLKDFYLVGEKIEAIWQRLTTGIAIIGLQKPQGRSAPLGGDMALDKCRIMVALDPGNPNKAEMVVGKNWANKEQNPVGLVTGYKLVQGARFIQTCPWQTKEEFDAEYKASNRGAF
jgi:hypothetical protein